MTSPPKVAQLSLDDSRTLTRDQGRLHSEGTGAGSDMATLSSVAHSQHAAISPIVLSYSSSFRAAQSAMNPANLPKAPTELPTLPVVGEADPTLHAGSPPSGVSSTAASSVVPTPDHSRPPTPPGSSFSPPPNGTAALLPTAVLSKSASPSAPLSTTSSVSGTTSTLTAKASVKSTAEKAEKKSVFGKLFERNNASSSSVVSSSGATAGSPPMDRADGSTNSNVGTAAPLTRKISKKEKDKEEKAQEKKDKDAARPRAESNGYLSAGAASDKGGMGAALNEFMRNKVARKSSATSKKSDDGKSDDGKKSNAGGEGSQYGGSTKDETKSKSGMTTTSTLKKYGVCEKVLIGKGATAVVKLAHKWDRTTERLYAVKEFRKRRKNETEKEYVKKLTSEFCISSTLHHQNIVETVDLVQDEQSHWCEVMEYCPGGDLYAAIKKGDMASAQINSYFKQILCGVSYLHSMGVAHRDIKPENLLLDAKGHVKITDFGVSDVFRMCWEKTTHLSKGLCGSEPYIAPEQFEQKEYDARLVDVWACAVVFYCMHFQELPWRVAKPSDPSFGPYLQMYPGSASPPPLSNLVPRECRAIIKRMLDPDPKTRVGTEEVMADPWVQGIVVIPPLEGIIPPPAVNPPLHPSGSSTPAAVASPLLP